MLGKSPIGHRFCYFSIVSGQNKWHLNRFSITLPQAYGCFEENDPVSRRLCFELLYLDTWNLKQVLTMIIRIKLLLKAYLISSDLTRVITLDNLLLPRSSSLLCHYKLPGGLWFQLSHIFFSLKARH